MLLNRLIDKLEHIYTNLSFSNIKVLVNNVLEIKSIDISLDNFNRTYINITTDNSNRAILDKVSKYLYDNLERYDDHIGLTKEEFIKEMIKIINNE